MITDELLTEVCAEVRNYFAHDDEKYVGAYEITNGAITPQIDLQTAYMRIVGSHRNDGVHATGATLENETFGGAVWALSIPKAFLDLCEEIQAWNDKYGGTDGAALSPFSSESFGGYSYTKASGGAGSVDGSVGWKSVFAQRLNLWRRIKV